VNPTGGHSARAPLARRNLGLEYLRFALAFAVLLYHYFYLGPRVGALPETLTGDAAFQFGRFGVAAFFVISGFVIAQSAEGKPWQSFLASRIGRLWPAIVVCAALTALLAGTLHPGREMADLQRFAMAAPLVTLAAIDRGYIDPSYWSITTELRFYALVLVLIMLTRLDRLPLVLSVFGVITFGMFFLGIEPAASAYLLFPYVGFFGLGVVFFRYLADHQTGPAALHGSIHLGLAILGTHVWNVRYSVFEDAIPSFLQSTLIALGALILVAVAYFLGRNLAVAPLAPLAGGVSYPLYLLHQRFGFDLIGAYSAVMTPELARLLTIVSVIGIAALIHIFIERPLGRPLKARIWRVLGGQPA